MATAILVDGSYFIKRYRGVSNPATHYDPKAVARDLFTWCLKHLDDRDVGRRSLAASRMLITFAEKGFAGGSCEH